MEPLHPKLVHLPIALAVLMPLITGGLLLSWVRGWLPRRAWWGAVLLQVVLLGSGLMARSAGEEDEERVEKVVPHDAIEEHEEAATLFLIGAGVGLALILAGAVLRSEKAARLAAGASVVVALAGVWLGVHVGEEGGHLVYKYGAASVFVEGAAPAAPSAPSAPSAAPAAVPPAQ